MRLLDLENLAKAPEQIHEQLIKNKFTRYLMVKDLSYVSKSCVDERRFPAIFLRVQLKKERPAEFYIQCQDMGMGFEERIQKLGQKRGFSWGPKSNNPVAVPHYTSIPLAFEKACRVYHEIDKIIQEMLQPPQ